ncbi:MAG: DoxX family membrane protein [Luteitalea sp.]|nr:DoxX family membrane protein [Luteitalea sp.]
MLLSGRMVFATAMAGFGIVSLVFVDFVKQLQPVGELVPASTPGYGLLAILTGVVLIAAGLAIMANVKTYQAAIVLTVLFAVWIVFLQVPSAFLNPSLLRSPWWVRTFETVVLAGTALILAGLTSQPTRKRWVRIGRLLFGVSLPVFGVLHFIYAENVASLVPSVYPWPLFLAYFTGAAKLAAGAAIAVGVLPRLAAIMVAILYGAYALTLHIPHQFMDQPVGYQPRGVTSMFVAIAFCGAALIVAGSLARQDQPPDA